MKSKKTTKTATPDLTPRALMLHRQRQRKARLVLKARRQKSGQ